MSREIPLTKGLVALVDDEDYETLAASTWCVRGNPPYASRHIQLGYRRYGQETMHRAIMGATDGQHVDHINGDTLDNRRANLRLCTHYQNMCNRRPNAGRKFKGVYRHGKGWRVTIQAEGQKVCIGTFPSEEIAARAYDEAARQLHGEFARLNFPEAA